LFKTTSKFEMCYRGGKVWDRLIEVIPKTEVYEIWRKIVHRLVEFLSEFKTKDGPW